MTKRLLVMLTVLALTGCGSSGSSKNAGTRARSTAGTTAPTSNPIKGCQGAVALQLSAPATAKFRSTTVLGKTATGTTVTGTVDSKYPTGSNQRDRFICINRTSGGPIAMDEGLSTSAPTITKPLELSASCIAAGQLTTSTATTPPDCPTVVHYGLAISADGQYKPLADVVELLGVVCSASHYSGPQRPVCAEADRLKPH